MKRVKVSELPVVDRHSLKAGEWYAFRAYTTDGAWTKGRCWDSATSQMLGQYKKLHAHEIRGPIPRDTEVEL